LVNDTYLKALKNLPSLKNKSAVKAWVYSIATNLARNNYRVKKRWADNAQDKCRILAESDDEALNLIVKGFQSTTEKHFEIKEHLDFCFTCMAKTLPLEHQLAIILPDIYAFKRKEIAQILEKTEGVIKHWLFNGRKSLQDKFENRCALINKKGACYQCAELNDYFNFQKDSQHQLTNLGFTSQNTENKSKKELYKLRTLLVKEIDPLQAKNHSGEQAIMLVLNQAMGL